MRHLLILAFLSLAVVHTTTAQQRDININAETLNSVLTGKWKLINAAPDMSVAPYMGFTVQGPGYGLVYKLADGKVVSLVSKIVANNSGIVFSDANGDRSTFKVTYLTKKSITMQAGKTILMFEKEQD